MRQDFDHERAVDAFIARLGQRASRRKRVAEFERALGRVWRRARKTLGVVTLSAIGERVLFAGVERFPLLAAVRIDDEGMQLEALARGARSDDAAVTSALCFVFVEILTLLDRLSGGILTPALYVELERDGGGGAQPDATGRRSRPKKKKQGPRS